MSDCNNNCEAVAGLNEAAANIVQYRNLINSWLNGAANATVNVAGVNTPTLLKLVTDLRTRINQMPQSILQQNGGIAIDENGKLYINFATMPDSILYGLLQKIVLQDGGLAFNNQGKMYVDFENMPTDKFDDILETFRKGLRLPKWLTGATNFYVNKSHAGASDTLDEGRGLTASKPFKTIQACVNNIADNYNVGAWPCRILVAGGEYAENLVLPNYNYTTGHVVIRPASASDQVVLKHDWKTSQGAYAVRANGAYWELDSIDLQVNLTADDSTRSGSLYKYHLYVDQGATLALRGVKTAIANSQAISGHRLNEYFCYCAGQLDLDPWGAVRQRNSELVLSVQTLDANHFVTAFSIAGLLRLIGNQDTAAQAKMLVGGSVSTFAQSTGGLIAFGGNFTHQLEFQTKSGSSVSGKRYEAVNGGHINVSGGGNDYFPGSTAGSVEAATYSWYKG